MLGQFDIFKLFTFSKLFYFLKVIYSPFRILTPLYIVLELVLKQSTERVFSVLSLLINDQKKAGVLAPGARS